MSDMVYGPETKAHIKDSIYAALYEQVDEKFSNQMDALIIENSGLNQNQQRLMKYRGEFKYHSQYDKNSRVPASKINSLHPSLEPRYLALMKEKDRINNDELPFVLGYVNQVLNVSNGFEDYYKLFPALLHPILDKLKQDCPCRNAELPQELIDSMLSQSQKSIAMLEQRAMTNLLMV